MIKRKNAIWAPLLFLILSCGQDVKNNKPTQEEPVRNERSDRPVFNDLTVENQKVVCEDKDTCPAFVAKVMISSRGVYSSCTGTLIEGNKVITSASCIPESLRTSQLDCSDTIFVFFPATSQYQERRSACKLIHKLQFGNSAEMATWKRDYLIFELKEQISREYSRINKEADFSQDSAYDVWSAVTIDGFNSVVKSQTCSPVYESYANPFAVNQHSSFVPLANCQSLSGGVGAAVLSTNDELLAVMSSPLNTQTVEILKRQDLLSEDTLTFSHSTNTKCISFAEEPLNIDCNISTSIRELDILRSRLLTSTDIHDEFIQKIINSAESSSKYIRWQVSFYKSVLSNLYEAHLTPRCFVNPNSWMNEFEGWVGRIKRKATRDVTLPKFVFGTKLNKLLKPISFQSSEDDKVYTFTFSPRAVANDASSYVNMESNLFGAYRSDKFENITTDCL